MTEKNNRPMGNTKSPQDGLFDYSGLTSYTLS